MKHKKKQGKKQRKDNRNHTRHHIFPRSRIHDGNYDENNIVLLPKEWHNIWHQLFENLTVEEVHDYIDFVMEPGKKWTHHDLLIMLEAMKGGGQWTLVEEEDDC